MESIGKYLDARILPRRPGATTDRWEILNNTQGAVLGRVLWFPSWRQYIFEPNAFTSYNTTCLRDITAFLTRCNDAQKAQRSVPT